MKRLLWQEDLGSRKHHLVNWKTICLLKDIGGLGVLKLELMYISLLVKWLWKLEHEDGVWQDLLQKKYLSNQTLPQAKKKPGQSQFWGSDLY